MPVTDVSDVPNLMLRVANVTCACLADTPLGVPAVCGLYHTTPPDDCCDYALVWLDDLVPTQQFPLEMTGQVPPQCDLRPIARIGIRVMRPCWPAARRDASEPFPPGDETTLASANLAMDGIRLFCCLTGDITSPTSTILGDTFVQTGITVGRATPRKGMGGCAGWTMYLTVDLEACCS